MSNSKRPVIVYLNPEQDRKAAVINPSGFKNFWGGKNSGVQCEIIRTKKRKKSKKNKNSDRPSDNNDQEGFNSSLHSDWSVSQSFTSELLRPLQFLNARRSLTL